MKNSGFFKSWCISHARMAPLNLHQINTVIGRRPVINGNNAINLTWRPLMTSTNQTTIFVTRNVLQPITTVFGGHRVRIGQGSIEGGFTYNLDFFGKRSLKIGSIRAKIPLGSNHFVQVQANGVEEAHHLLSVGDNLIDSLSLLHHHIEGNSCK